MTLVIGSEAEAIEVAIELSGHFAKDSAERDAIRRLPRAELDLLPDSGPFGVSVPREHGGAGATAATLAGVFRPLGLGDPDIARIPLSHIVHVDMLRGNATLEQRRFFHAEVPAGRRSGNARSEADTRHVRASRTCLRRGGARPHQVPVVVRERRRDRRRGAPGSPTTARRRRPSRWPWRRRTSTAPRSSSGTPCSRSPVAARWPWPKRTPRSSSRRPCSRSPALAPAWAVSTCDTRTHTRHDPVRWKIQHVGRYTLNGTRPPRHGVI
ncbi:acyl-CoA dehydrogenase family protein [Sphaerisporangium sp. B11E5]|uniref:acyl-CoA dehydrogenase family protein n=1 Tax=Sphaerisporangium sp. B11E5 TaxID=3153563 RepID=UPI00325D4C3B